MFNKSNHEARIRILKEQAKNAKSMGVKSVLLHEANQLQREINEFVVTQTNQYWAELHAKYANVEAEQTVEVGEPKKRGRKPKEEVTE